jgi:hypothetical protein
MSNFALLSTDAQEILETSRKDFLAKKTEILDKTQKDLAIAVLSGVAREAVNCYPEVRYVTIDRPGRNKDLRILRITEVLDKDRNALSNHNGKPRTLSWKIEDLLLASKAHLYIAIETGEYDFVELASRQF